MAQIPIPYKPSSLYIEPVSALAGAYYAGLQPWDYLKDLSLAGNPPRTIAVPPATALTTQTEMSLMQLSNLYLLFALNEHLVLSSTNSIKTWKRLLFCLLVADFGHLFTMTPLGVDAFWKVSEWNAMIWGSVAFVYLGASMRMAFLLDCGLSPSLKVRAKSAKD